MPVMVSLEGNLFQLRVTSSEALIQEGIIRLRTSLFLFYRLYHEENPAEEFSSLGDLSEKTLGQRSGSQSLGCKGAETRMLVPFSIWLFQMHPGVVPQEDIILMGLEALEGMVNTVRAAPTNMSTAEMQMVHAGLKRISVRWIAGHWSGAKASFVHSLDPQYSIARESTDLRSVRRRGLQWKAEEDRCGLPPHGLPQARPCRLPHCARPRVRGPRDS